MTALEIVEFVAGSIVQAIAAGVAFAAARRRSTLASLARARYPWPWFVLGLALSLMVARATTGVLVQLGIVEIDWRSIEGAARFAIAVLVLVAVREIAREGERAT